MKALVVLFLVACGTAAPKHPSNDTAIAWLNAQQLDGASYVVFDVLDTCDAECRKGRGIVVSARLKGYPSTASSTTADIALLALHLQWRDDGFKQVNLGNTGLIYRKTEGDTTTTALVTFTAATAEITKVTGADPTLPASFHLAFSVTRGGETFRGEVDPLPAP